MSSEDEKPQKKKLFDFDVSEVGLRSINLLNRSIPTSKWEITPRTATQSKKLKWDQTPFGLMKTELNDANCNYTMENTSEYQQNDFMFNKKLSLDEINSILPKVGYSIFNIWNNENIEEIDFQLFDNEEKSFFSPFNETTNEDIKDIYKGLYILRKIKRNRSKRVLKVFESCKNKNLALEKVILYCFSFNLTIKEKYLILKIINGLLNVAFTREVLYILAKFSEEEELKQESKDVFKKVFNGSFDDYKEILEREIKQSERETRDMISILISIGIDHFGLKDHLIWFKESCVYGKSKEKMIILHSLITIVKKLKNSLHLFAKDLLTFIEMVVRDSKPFIKSIVGYLICLLIEHNILEDNIETFDILLKMFYDLLNDNKSNPYKEKWLSIWIKTLSQIKKGRPQIIFDLLKEHNLKDKNVFKILKNIVGRVENMECFIVECIEECFIEDNKNSLISFFRRLDNSEIIRNELITFVLNSDRTNLTLEVISSSKNIFYLTNDFYDNFFIALRNTEIKNGKILKWIFEHTKEIDKFKKLFLEQINSENKKLQGLMCLIELVDLIDDDSICYIGNIVWEKIENLENEKLIKALDLLNRIYKRSKFKSFDEIIYFCSSKLRKEDKKTKKMIFEFLLTVIKNNSIKAAGFDKMEFIRISYEASECLTEVGKTSRRIIVEFIVMLGMFVNLQDLVDIFIHNLFEVENYKGNIEALIEISNKYGMFYILPKILIKYETCTFSLKLRICKLLIGLIESKSFIEEKYISSFIALIEDLILDREVEMRRYGLKLISVFIKSPTVNSDIILHLLNLSWFCVLDDTGIEIVWDRFIRALGCEILVKYLLQGLYHPSKKVRMKYETLFSKLKTEMFIEDNSIENILEV